MFDLSKQQVKILAKAAANYREHNHDRFFLGWEKSRSYLQGICDVFELSCSVLQEGRGDEDEIIYFYSKYNSWIPKDSEMKDIPIFTIQTVPELRIITNLPEMSTSDLWVNQKFHQLLHAIEVAKVTKKQYGGR